MISEMRWWSKDAALRKMFGSYSKPDCALYIDIIATLTKIQENARCNPVVRMKAKGYTESLLKYETILTAQIFLRIFECTSTLSKYLQTSGMNILAAYHMVSATQEDLRKCVRDFDAVKKAADNFVEWANDKLLDREDCELEVQAALPAKRTRKKKTMPGESSEDETVSDATTAYKIKVHNVIFDTVAESIHRRFLNNGTLYADFACLDPRNFTDIKKCGLKTQSLKELSKRLLKYDERATVDNLQSELTIWHLTGTSLRHQHRMTMCSGQQVKFLLKIRVRNVNWSW